MLHYAWAIPPCMATYVCMLNKHKNNFHSDTPAVADDTCDASAPMQARQKSLKLPISRSCYHCSSLS